MSSPSKNQPKKKGHSEQTAPRHLEEGTAGDVPNGEIPQGLRQVMKDLPEEKQVILRREILTLRRSSHSGPLPSFETLDGYEQTLPGAADRVFKMAENQQEHRIGMEKMVVRRQLNQSGTGQWMAFILAVLFLASGVYLGLEGHDWLAGGIVGSTLIGLVTVFIRGKSSVKKSLEEKSSVN